MPCSSPSSSTLYLPASSAGAQQLSTSCTRIALQTSQDADHRNRGSAVLTAPVVLKPQHLYLDLPRPTKSETVAGMVTCNMPLRSRTQTGLHRSHVHVPALPILSADQGHSSLPTHHDLSLGTCLLLLGGRKDCDIMETEHSVRASVFSKFTPRCVLKTSESASICTVVCLHIHPLAYPRLRS